MTNDVAAVVTELSEREDPRLDHDLWRVLPATDERAAAILVGVVHDHPASMHRVKTVVSEFAPGTVALELPPTTLPYFVRTASAAGEDTEVTGPDGGEMGVAIAAAGDADVVAIDSLDTGFFVRFARRARAVGASLGTVKRALGSASRIARHAVNVRFGRHDGSAVHGDAGHAVTATDAPAVQSDDERTQVSRSRSLLGAIERPPSDVLLDETRERNMAAKIDDLRADGSVVAVVGMDHLDDVADALADDS